MPGLTITPDARYDPDFSAAPRVYVREKWSDDWQPRPELRLVRARLAAAGDGQSELALQWSYGSIAHPWDADYQTYESIDLAGWWVKLALVGPDGETTQWAGKLFGVPREIEGADYVRSGEQTWIAHGPQEILDRVWIHESWHDGSEVGGSSEDPIKLGWMPGVNALDEHGLLLGNRSEHKTGGVYLYGNQADWTYRQYIEYLLAKWADESDLLDRAGGPDPGPAWRLAGQADLLDGLTGVVDLDAVESVGALLRRLIAPRYGASYKIRYCEPESAGDFDGFEISVFALLGEDVRFMGETLPQNPDVVSYEAAVAHWQTKTLIEERRETFYNLIRIVGRRAVICCSLGGENCPVTEIADTLEGKWSNGLQLLYEAACGPATHFSPEDHDRFRQDDRFSAVFGVWAAPPDWHRPRAKALYACDFDGLFDPDAAAEAPHQLAVRATLDWTPLRRNVDYSQDPAVDATPAGHTSDLLPPCVWVRREADGYVTWPYERADQVGIGVSALRHDWGVQLSSSPNHLVAKNSFLATAPTRTAPLYEDLQMVATIAFEAEARPVAEMVVDYVPEQRDRPSAGILEIYDETIEVWILAPYTVVGLDPTGELLTSGPVPRVLRQDSQRLHLVMAGAIARHQRDRARAELHAEGLVPWADLLGKILATVEEAGDTHDVQCPITSIEWTTDAEGIATTIIRAGFAGSEEQD